MKALITNSSTTVTWWLRRGSIGLAALFMVVALGFGLVGVLYLSGPAQITVPASPVNLYSPLDQHERHPAGFVNLYAPLDQHERHPAGLPNN
jgi:hypothetical protein